MATIKIYGSSDDLIEVEMVTPGPQVKGCDEYNVDAKDCLALQIHSNLNQEEVGVLIQYSPARSGTWTAAPFLMDEGAQLPNWNFRYEKEHEYSVALLMDVPADAVVMLHNTP